MFGEEEGQEAGGEPERVSSASAGVCARARRGVAPAWPVDAS